MTSGELECLLWNQADTLYNDARGWRYTVEVEGRRYYSQHFIPSNEIPEDEEGAPDYETVYSWEFEPYADAMEDLLKQINE